MLSCVLWIALLTCVWQLPFLHCMVIVLIVLAYGITERWIGMSDSGDD